MAFREKKTPIKRVDTISASERRLGKGGNFASEAAREGGGGGERSISSTLISVSVSLGPGGIFGDGRIDPVGYSPTLHGMRGSLELHVSSLNLTRGITILPFPRCAFSLNRTSALLMHPRTIDMNAAISSAAIN